MELKTIILILEVMLLGAFCVFIFGVSLGLMFKIAEKIQDWW